MAANNTTNANKALANKKKTRKAEYFNTYTIKEEKILQMVDFILLEWW